MAKVLRWGAGKLPTSTSKGAAEGLRAGYCLTLLSEATRDGRCKPQRHFFSDALPLAVAWVGGYTYIYIHIYIYIYIYIHIYIHIYIYILAYLMNMNTQTPEYPSSLPPASRFGPCFLETTELTSCGSSMGDLGEGRRDEWRGSGRAWSGIPSLGGMVSWWFHHVLWCFMMFNDVFDDVSSIWPFFCINIMDTEWPICSRIMNLWLSSYLKVLIDTHYHLEMQPWTLGVAVSRLKDHVPELQASRQFFPALVPFLFGNL